MFIGPQTDERELAALADVIRASPERWIAQELVHLSTVPTVTADGTLGPRHVDLRPFAVYGDEVRIVPGGLTRVALTEGSMIVNSSRGGGSKDTWVLEDATVVAPAPRPAMPDVSPPLRPRTSQGEWSGQQQHQQQSARR